MVNLSPDTIVFNLSCTELSEQVRKALELAAEQHLIVTGLQDICLETVTTKTNLRGTFAKFVKGKVLKNTDRHFNMAYVELALEAYKAKKEHLTKEPFDVLMAADEDGPYSYKRTYAIAVKSGLGLFLVALHSSGAITLPSTFSWPTLRHTDGRSREICQGVASELLSFVRTLDPQCEPSPGSAFTAINGNETRRYWFLSYGTKLLLATGWHKPEDANLDDLLKIKAAERVINEKNDIPFAYLALLDTLNLAFPGRIKTTSEDWDTHLKLARPRKFRDLRVSVHSSEDELNPDYDLLKEILNLSPGSGRPERIRSLRKLPGLEVDLTAISKRWLDIEEMYILKMARESYKLLHSALGWWNIYIFYYLPYWFARNPGCSWSFPSSPSLLAKSVFVSRLLPIEEKKPLTFMEVMNVVAERRKWRGNSFYSVLTQLQLFFEFVEHNSEEIAGCEGFTQPLAPYDFPRSSRTRNTNKQPVPRRFFGVFLDYYEALIAHHTVVLNKVLTGEISEDGRKRLRANGSIIDTFATSDLVGFIPILFVNKKAIALQFIPNVLIFRMKTVRDGRRLMLPHPHALYQNLVALHTGVRHNHIQWLDRDKFDAFVNEVDTDFSNLFVNTDKQMSKPWTPYVSFRVIELLRAQRQWCELIENPSFHEEHFYNDNPRTKWPKIRPLFAFAKNGKPHDDSVYNDVWKSVLCGLQALMPELSEFGQSHRLLHLLPPNHAPNDANLQKKLIEYGATFTKMGQSCKLRVHTLSTPHSSRSAVVSQYMTFLPTDLIGKYITGQKPGTVAYYVHLEKEDLETEQVHQAARMRDAVLKGAFEPVSSESRASSSFIHADSVNANLVRSIKTNLEDTITSYGGIQISFGERAKGGIEVLRETGCANVAFNKTEVCPYGNNCPSDIIKELNGLRRCSLCPYAVRFVDHLPALMAKQRQVAEAVDEIERIFATDQKTLNAKYTEEELDVLDADRARLCEDLTGWILHGEVLEVMRQRIAAGQDTRNWTVQRPQIIEQDLKRVSVQTSESEYLLARLGECIAFPMLESPQVRARFELLRRELVASAGKVSDALALPSVDPAMECAGMLRTVVASHGFTISEIVSLLESDNYMRKLPKTDLRLLSGRDMA